MKDDRGENRVLVVLGAAAAVATILTFLFQFNVLQWPFGGNGANDGNAECQSPQVSLSTGSGQSGTEVELTGTGFPSNENVMNRFHTEALLPAQTDGNGKFQVTIVIPGTFDVFAPTRFEISSTTLPSVCRGTAQFDLTSA